MKRRDFIKNCGLGLVIPSSVIANKEPENQISFSRNVGENDNSRIMQMWFHVNGGKHGFKPRPLILTEKMLQKATPDIPLEEKIVYDGHVIEFDLNEPSIMMRLSVYKTRAIYIEVPKGTRGLCIMMAQPYPEILR